MKCELKIAISAVLVLFLLSCRKEKKAEINELPSAVQATSMKLDYATGFNILNQSGFDVLEVTNPWPNSKKTFRYALIPKAMAAKVTLNRDEFDGIITTPLESIVVTSTTHIPALELLGVEKRLVGFPGTDYISSESTRQLIDKEEIRELGQNESLNTEVLFQLNPDAVVAFGVEGSNKSLEVVKKANIPVIYNGDWTEVSPLGKAEWIKFFGALFDKEAKADSIFKGIERTYLEAKILFEESTSKPTALSGAMNRDVWNLPAGNSPEAILLKDAGFNYLWSDTDGNGSLSLNFEAVLDKARDADVWISPSHYTSKEALGNASALYSNFKAFKTGHVYSFANKKGSTGGVIYYELGTARPDLVLKDLIKIAHPELLPDYQMTFFQKLD